MFQFHGPKLFFPFPFLLLLDCCGVRRYAGFLRTVMETHGTLKAFSFDDMHIGIFNVYMRTRMHNVGLRLT